MRRFIWGQNLDSYLGSYCSRLKWFSADSCCRKESSVLLPWTNSTPLYFKHKKVRLRSTKCIIVSYLVECMRYCCNYLLLATKHSTEKPSITLSKKILPKTNIICNLRSSGIKQITEMPTHKKWKIITHTTGLPKYFNNLP